MTTQKRIGLLFLLLGIVIIAAALAPVIQHPPTPINIWILGAGIVVAVLGALIYPSSGAGPALQQIIVNVAPFVPRFGGQRAGDPPAPPSDKSGGVP